LEASVLHRALMSIRLALKAPFRRSRFAGPLLAGAVLASSAWGCSTYSTHVGADDGSLGKVVVYRNGIAYFERKADPSGNAITLRVPQDKVDDFLKSLTVRDAATGKTHPVSFPTQAASNDGNVDMVIQLPDSVKGEVVLSYITDSPSWKPSYRLVVGEGGEVAVQGWAVVDNTSGEDWKAVRLGVGSSSALSFKYDLRTIRLVHRETLRDQQQFALAPPGGETLIPGREGKEAVLAELDDLEIPRPADHPDLAQVTSGPMGGMKHGDGLAPSAPAAAQPQRSYGNASSIRQMAESLKKSKQKVVIQGYADKGERDADARGLDRANLLRNQLIEEGVAPALLDVATGGVAEGRKAGVVLIAKDDGDRDEAAVSDGGKPIGESHFESSSTMTVERGTSAMVAILDQKAQGEIVYLYDADSPRGNAKFAFKAVRFQNPTNSTLETGPVTVYGEGRFIGEGLSEPIPPGTTAFVPFALDRQVLMDKDGSTGDRISRLITLQRGVLTTELQHTRKSVYKVTNRSTAEATVYVKHAVPKGWTLLNAPKKLDRLGDSVVYALTVPAGENQTLTVEEATPITRTIDLRSPAGIELVRVYLEAGSADPKFAESMKKLLAIHKGIANVEQQISTVREQMDDYRARLDELEAQIVHLKSVKTDGKLLRHLQDKMVEVSERIQKSTIQVVELQQSLLLQRVEFQDGVSELTLDRGVAAR
jgi:hypothetical protein